MQILEMLRDGKVSADEAAELLKALSAEEARGPRRGGEGEFNFGKMFGKLFGMKVFPGGAEFEQATDVKGPLTIGGSAKFLKDVKVTGPITAGGSAQFHGQSEHSGPIKCGGRLGFQAPAKVESDSIKVGGSLRFADKADVSVKENFEVKRDLVLEPGAELSITGNLVVDGEVIDKRKLGVEALAPESRDVPLEGKLPPEGEFPPEGEGPPEGEIPPE